MEGRRKKELEERQKEERMKASGMGGGGGKNKENVKKFWGRVGNFKGNRGKNGGNVV